MLRQIFARCVNEKSVAPDRDLLHFAKLAKRGGFFSIIFTFLYVRAVAADVDEGNHFFLEDRPSIYRGLCRNV